MEQLIHERYTDAIKAEVLQRFQLEESQVKAIGGFESFIYEIPYHGEKAILRVSHSQRYDVLAMQGELDFLRYLRQAGANVASSLPAPTGEYLEIIDDGHGGQFMVALFEKAQGEHLRGTWSDSFIQHYGQTLGKLHRLSTAYFPSKPEWTRGTWDAPKALNYDVWLKTFDAEVHAKFQANLETIRALPKTPQNYGLIHQDAHTGNLFVDAGKITLFDFADCCQGYFVNDVAMVLFYALRSRQDAPQAFISHVFTQFWQGYHKEFSLSKEDLAQIPYFFRLREIDLYAIIERDIDWRNNENTWLTNFMTGRRERILNEIPYVDVKFSELR